jgi:hypothetical protein
MTNNEIFGFDANLWKKVVWTVQTSLGRASIPIDLCLVVSKMAMYYVKLFQL